MECRSAERRQWIVNKYDVVPVANQTKHSDAGAMIENDYFFMKLCVLYLQHKYRVYLKNNMRGVKRNYEEYENRC